MLSLQEANFDKSITHYVRKHCGKGENDHIKVPIAANKKELVYKIKVSSQWQLKEC